MPQRTQPGGKGLVHMLFLAAALSLLSAVVRRDRSQLVKTTRARRKKVRVAPRKIAASLAFATLFFAGAALSAGAGNSVTSLLDQSSESAMSSDTTTGTTTTEAPAAAPAEAAPAEAPAASQHLSGGPVNEADPPADQPAPVEAQAPADAQAAPAVSESAAVQAALSQHVRAGVASNGANAQAPQASKKDQGAHASNFNRQAPVILSQPKVRRAPFAREPEADEPNVAATVWLNRTLPDPTPPSRRLKPAFARRLARVSARNHVDWALTLAVLRSERGAVPASKARLKTLAKQLHSLHSQRNAWTSVLSLEGRTTFADQTIALQHLYRAVGLKALVKGFDWAKPSLSKRILNDKRITIYPGGRSDIEAGRVNIRVLVLIAYLAEAHGQVTVSCLISGHRLYARPGVISAHIYGLAADISTLGNTPIFGHQQPGGVTEQGSAKHPPAAGRDAAEAGHLPARARRAVVPARQPLRPHPRRLLDARADPQAGRRDSRVRAVHARRLPGDPPEGLARTGRAGAGRRPAAPARLVDPHVLHALSDRRRLPRPGARRARHRRRRRSVARRLPAGGEGGPRASGRRELAARAHGRRSADASRPR